MDWTDVNKNYALCAQAGCPRRAECLRWQAGQQLPPASLQWLYVSHHLQQQAGPEGCPAFRTAQPQRVALGFRQALGEVAGSRRADVYREVCQALGTGQTHYYKLRRGLRAMTPREQELVAAVLARHGAAEPVEFDAYEERIVWE